MSTTLLLLQFSQPASPRAVDAASGHSAKRSVRVFAANNIPIGAQISATDLEESVINAKGFKNILRRESLIGRVAKYSIKSGQILDENVLVPNFEKRQKVCQASCKSASFIQAKKTIPAGSIILASDLETGTVNSFDSSHWLNRFDSIVGIRAKKTIVAGQILTTDFATASNPPRNNAAKP